MNNVLSLPPSTTMTPKQALLSAMEFADADNLDDVIIVGYDADGKLLVRSSRMDIRTALWLTEKLRMYILDLG